MKPRRSVGRRSGPWDLRWPIGAVVLWLAWLVVPSGAEASTLRRSLGDGMVATLTDGGDLMIEATPRKGEGLWAFTRRLTGGTEAVEEVSRLNRRPRRLLSGVRYKVPYAVLTSSLKVQVIRKIFPEDQTSSQGWRFRVPAGRTLTTWRVCEWLTGRGSHFSAVGQLNRLNGEYTLQPGQLIIVPGSLLLPPFRQLLPPPSAVAQNEPEPPPPASGSEGAAPQTFRGTGANGQLTYTTDAAGDFAIYRLKRGEALYSSVVVRFTGVVTAKEVNDIAGDLARLNDITDVTDMPVGQSVRIPFDLLLPEYLPAADPRRREWETNRAESAKYSNTVSASRLEGITVILDAGHGGHDPGTNYKGTWESVYVYDVMMRVKKLLESATAARVEPTTRDGSSFRLVEKDVLPTSRRHVVLTSPEYPIRDTKVSANLRWYLANSRHRQAVRRSGDDSKTIFISIHADSLHRSLRGAMVYVPATSLTKGAYGKSGRVYLSRTEVKEKPRVSYTWKERTRSEGLSRQFAKKLLDQFRRHGLAVHKEKPIRDRIIRCRRCRAFVPAVVRRNAVPTKVLVEIGNMNNGQDRKLLRTQAFRQKVAVALVDSILAYYGQPALPDPPPRLAARSRHGASQTSTTRPGTDRLR